MKGTIFTARYPNVLAAAVTHAARIVRLLATLPPPGAGEQARVWCDDETTPLADAITLVP